MKTTILHDGLGSTLIRAMPIVAFFAIFALFFRNFSIFPPINSAWVPVAFWFHRTVGNGDNKYIFECALIIYVCIFSAILNGLFREEVVQRGYHYPLSALARDACLVIVLIAACFRHVFQKNEAGSDLRFLSLIGLPAMAKFCAFCEFSGYPTNPNRKLGGYLCMGWTTASCAAVWFQPLDLASSHFHQIRWQWPCGYPNTFGALMGMSLLIVVGNLLKDRFWPIRVFKASINSSGLITSRFIQLIFVASLAFGLLMSYSRSAWIGTVIGGGWLVCFFGLRSICFSRTVNCLILIVATALTLMVVFFKKEETIVLINRVLSMADVNDFSWRNRIVTSVGAMQVVADHFWIGAGWAYKPQTYIDWYQPLSLTDGHSIALNDFLNLTAILGFPIACCFVGIIYWSFFSRSAPSYPPSRPRLPSDFTEANSSTVAFQGGGAFSWFDREAVLYLAPTIPILCNFWFNSGLFNWSLAVPFWILLELGFNFNVASIQLIRISHVNFYGFRKDEAESEF